MLAVATTVAGLTASPCGAALPTRGAWCPGDTTGLANEPLVTRSAVTQADDIAAVFNGSRREELSESTRLDDRRALVTGDRGYMMGDTAGLYPACGWHIRGEMGGFWSPPIKLLDGIWSPSTVVGWGPTSQPRATLAATVITASATRPPLTY